MPAGDSLTDSGDVLVRFIGRVRGSGKAPMLERIDGGAKRRRLDGHDERWFAKIDAALLG